MNYMTLEEAMQEVNWSGEGELLSVYATLEQIQDGRHKRGVRSSVALILTLIRLGKIGWNDHLASDRRVGAPP